MRVAALRMSKAMPLPACLARGMSCDRHHKIDRRYTGFQYNHGIGQIGHDGGFGRHQFVSVILIVANSSCYYCRSPRPWTCLDTLVRSARSANRPQTPGIFRAASVDYTIKPFFRPLFVVKTDEGIGLVQNDLEFCTQRNQGLTPKSCQQV